MKSVLVVIDSLGFGGAEKVLYTFLQYWNKEKYNITIVPIVDKGVYSSKIKEIENICFSPIISSDHSFLKRLYNKILYKLIYQILPLKWVYSIFLPHHNDIEIAFCEGFVTKLLSYSTNKKSKKITWVHTDLVNNNWPLSIGVYKDFEEETISYKKFNTIIGVSDIVCNGFIKQFGIPNIKRVYNPLDRKVIELSSNKHSKKRTGKHQIISIGRLVYDKGFDLLIDAYCYLFNEGHDVELTILGEGSLRSDLEQKIRNNHQEKNIHLVGFKDNPYSYLSESDIFVCSSRYEGFSLAIAEAMIVGLPIVSTKCAGPVELLENGVYGMMVDCSAEGLADGLKKMIDDQEVNNHFREKSKIRGNMFSVEESVEITEKLFDE